MTSLIIALSNLNQTLEEVIETPIVYAEVIEKIDTNEEAVALLKETFKDYPEMVNIAKCESGLRQWDANGEVLKGIANPLDTGMYQINRYYHEAEAVKRGYDLFSAEGNIDYAKSLRETQGTRPWNASKRCWEK